MCNAKKEALDYLNTLRRNRGFEVTDDLQENITDEKLQEAIGKEYRKEFIGEDNGSFIANVPTRLHCLMLKYLSVKLIMYFRYLIKN